MGRESSFGTSRARVIRVVICNASLVLKSDYLKHDGTDGKLWTNLSNHFNLLREYSMNHIVLDNKSILKLWLVSAVNEQIHLIVHKIHFCRDSKYSTAGGWAREMKRRSSNIETIKKSGYWSILLNLSSVRIAFSKPYEPCLVAVETDSLALQLAPRDIHFSSLDKERLFRPKAQSTISVFRMTMMRLSVIISLILSLAVPAAEANFFSRQIESKKEREDGSSAPAGASGVLGSEAQVGSVISFYNGVVFAKLVNNNRIPLVGYGVGNLNPELVKPMVSSALKENKKIQLIDTSHASKNEHLVAEGIVKGIESLNKQKKTEVHVVTKVWYTHLGYERTKISIRESLESLRPALDHPQVNLRLHVLLHWPRCYENVPWMDCAQEERMLPEHVKAAGPDPSLDPDNAWKQSWKALEDMYLSDEYPIASIGLSNFHLKEIEQVEAFAQIHPHVIQMNLWSLLYDARLIDYCHKHRIHVQAYNVVHGTVSNPDNAPSAYRHLEKVANELSQEIGEQLTPTQIVLAWLIQHGVSVIPRTTNVVRLEENSAVSLLNIPAFSDHQVETVAHAVEAYLSGDDLEDIHVSVTFHAKSKDVVLYWMGHNGDESSEVRIEILRVGETFDETTYPTHKFRAYDAQNKDIWTEHDISANYGDHVHIEL